MTAATFRLPGPLAISVAQVDQMSGGRVELGIGAGWFEAEHDRVRDPVPAGGGAVRPLRGAAGDRHRALGHPAGRDVRLRRAHYRLADSPALPKPVQDGGIPIIVGGSGKKRTPRLAARYADEFNVPFASVEDNARLFAGAGGLRGGRARPGVPGHSSALVLCVGKDDAEVARRAAAIGREVDELAAPRRGRHAGRGGRHARPLRRVGAQRVYLQVLDLADLDHLDLVAAEVAPQLG